MDRLIVDSARKWNFPVQWGRILFYLPPVLSMLLLATYFVDQSIVLTLAREDGILEWSTVAFFAAGGIVAGLSARRFFHNRYYLYAWLYVAVFLLGLVIAGEEISWGQRIFGWETPELLAENRQGELNLHNLPKSPFNYAPHAASAYGAVAYLLTQLVPAVRIRLKREADFLIPPFFLATSFGVCIVWLTVRMVTPYTPFASRYNEWCETLLAFGFMLYMVLARVRLSRSTKMPIGVISNQPMMAEIEL